MLFGSLIATSSVLPSLRDGDDFEFAGDIQRDQLDDFGIQLDIRQAKRADLEMLADKRGQLVFGRDRPHLDEHSAELLLLLLGSVQRLIGLLLGDLPGTDQNER